MPPNSHRIADYTKDIPLGHRTLRLDQSIGALGMGKREKYHPQMSTEQSLIRLWPYLLTLGLGPELGLPMTRSFRHPSS